MAAKFVPKAALVYLEFLVFLGLSVPKVSKQWNMRTATDVWNFCDGRPINCSNIRVKWQAFPSCPLKWLKYECFALVFCYSCPLLPWTFCRAYVPSKRIELESFWLQHELRKRTENMFVDFIVWGFWILRADELFIFTTYCAYWSLFNTI